ncbi:MAG: retropepsin-like domain-containing protein [Verrucomicrobiota bacterium]|nr:retropepsin-like domain-containing protein [Verrucomicrobiota bacterium]
MFQLAAFGCLMFLCSCATTSHQTAIVPATELPGDVTFKRGADRLIVKLRLENGQELPFLLDTGTTITYLPFGTKSMLPELGKRVSTATGRAKEKLGLYVAPKLYLGNTQLMTGNLVVSYGGKTAILGMDCLRRYCIQLNFAAGKIRFLDPNDADSAGWGTPFPLTFHYNLPLIRDGLLGENGSETLVDTGDYSDGRLTRRQLEEAVREQNGRFALRIEHGVAKGHWHGAATFQHFVWDGQTYTAVAIFESRQPSIGLRFLARHELVTFDFPKRMMYVSQQLNPNWKHNLWEDNLFHAHR